MRRAGGGASRGNRVAGAPTTNHGLTPRDIYISHLSFVSRQLRLLRLPDEAIEDAAHDVFLVVHRRWSSFDPTRFTTVEAWLFGIVIRTALNYRRRAARRSRWHVPNEGDLVSQIPSAQAGPADLFARGQASALLDRLLGTLDNDKRALIVLVDIEGMSMRDAAKLLGLNENTAHSRARTARKRLAKTMARIAAGAQHVGAIGRKKHPARKNLQGRAPDEHSK